ncbi:hypothetical protein AMAG_03301 [Allomyces macrogynus ATCC 38327]|uniref:Uncharacterized protein n=1 Tax=Allomyces macrogynus (strain ATCC 38327) TaxID=578462 RepID=A0A0L0S514_ALLM3|nr:hypothetical protein AMAG_03301 [Allomyces macrogynus ATCC 38327]|eukprot:KNE57612.1 hypothetical protein AMAG_03301 [Allomyces macrogynus ATCC 38327]
MADLTRAARSRAGRTLTATTSTIPSLPPLGAPRTAARPERSSNNGTNSSSSILAKKASALSDSGIDILTLGSTATPTPPPRSPPSAPASAAAAQPSPPNHAPTRSLKRPTRPITPAVWLQQQNGSAARTAPVPPATDRRPGSRLSLKSTARLLTSLGPPAAPRNLAPLPATPPSSRTAAPASAASTASSTTTTSSTSTSSSSSSSSSNSFRRLICDLDLSLRSAASYPPTSATSLGEDRRRVLDDAAIVSANLRQALANPVHLSTAALAHVTTALPILGRGLALAHESPGHAPLLAQLARILAAIADDPRSTSALVAHADVLHRIAAVALAVRDGEPSTSDWMVRVRLLYVLGNVTEQVEPVAEGSGTTPIAVLKPFVSDTVALLVRSVSRYAECVRLGETAGGSAVSGRKDEAGADDGPLERIELTQDVLIKIVRLLANVLQARSLGPTLTSDPRLLGILDALDLTLLPRGYDASMSVEPDPTTEELQVNLLLLLNNITFYQHSSNVLLAVPDAATTGSPSPRLVPLLVYALASATHPEVQAEALAVLANVMRVSKLARAAVKENVSTALVALLDAADPMVLLPLCGTWLNLIASRSKGAGATMVASLTADPDVVERILDIASVAVEHGHDKLLATWCQLVLTMRAVQPDWTISWAQRDELQACLDEASHKGMAFDLLETVLNSMMITDEEEGADTLGEDDMDDDGSGDLQELPSPASLGSANCSAVERELARLGAFVVQRSCD